MNSSPPTEVGADELLARFVTVDRWIREDKTVRPDAFIPPRDLNLSVTRHLNLSREELWNIGLAVAEVISRSRAVPLLGRIDLTVTAVAKTGLRTEADPIASNPNHAHITGWPLDKPTQKNIAQQLAAATSFISKPAEPPHAG